MRWCLVIALAGCWSATDAPPTPRTPPVVVAAIPAEPRRDCVAPEGDLEHGRKLIKRKHCLFCHRPRVAESMRRDCDPTGIRLAIERHTAIPTMTPEELDDLVAYVAATW
jgi:mono/diheme cytochrome c family protein